MVKMDGVLTESMILDAKKAMESQTERYNQEGYRIYFHAWQWRILGAELPGVPDNAMVSMAENGPMIITPQEKTWQRER